MQSLRPQASPMEPEAPRVRPRQGRFSSPPGILSSAGVRTAIRAFGLAGLWLLRLSRNHLEARSAGRNPRLDLRRAHRPRCPEPFPHRIHSRWMLELARSILSTGGIGLPSQSASRNGESLRGHAAGDQARGITTAHHGSQTFLTAAHPV